MFDYVAVLKANPVGILATRKSEGVGTRVFQFLFADGNKVYFCTGSEKPVYKQIADKPNVSFCTHPADFNPVLSVSGPAVFVDDIALKTRALDENPSIKGIYNTPGNPVFKLFYIDVKEVDTFSFAEGSKTYKI
ncbi:MAG: pyridoxamine 5'-phosphate oxidase family protein [Rickettsiales bacterium]|jgi:uncharacterized pyridoxamine 5'-phosphate oxidase family protein|nr:pyridoxamine 5'-phosphate oxidase family protein [Rickettsiales bacterium]